jgi:hypothetical protein
MRIERFARGELPANYYLTFSQSEANHAQVETALSLGVNVATVYALAAIPADAVNGDEHDLRFIDPRAARGKRIALKAKGPAKRDTSGFVVH